MIAWQKADQLASAVYRATKELPSRHDWLKNQILRCAVSVPANLAEGHGRGTRAELLHFIDIARGSLSELEYFIHFVASEGILPVGQVEVLEAKRVETGKVLFGLWRALKAVHKDEWDHTGNKIQEERGIYVAI